MSDEVRVVEGVSGPPKPVTRSLTYGELVQGDKFTTELDGIPLGSMLTLKVKLEDGHMWFNDGQVVSPTNISYCDHTPVIRYDTVLHLRPQPLIKEKT